MAASICWAVWGRDAGLSALAGGGISAAASAVLAFFAFRSPAGAEAASIARGFYLGEGLKLGVTVALLVVVFVTMKPVFPALFGAYIATLFVYWIALANALPALSGKTTGGNVTAAKR